jgi:hypothetical protein
MHPGLMSFVRKQTIDTTAHAQYRLGLMWFWWETIHLPLVIAMVAIAQFSQKVNSCAFANGRFKCRSTDKISVVCEVLSTLIC